MTKIDEVLNRLKDVQAEVRELTKQGAIHNTLLHEHEKRSTQLEHRVDPLEKDREFRAKLYSTILGLGALATATLSILKLFKTI